MGTSRAVAGGAVAVERRARVAVRRRRRGGAGDDEGGSGHARSVGLGSVAVVAVKSE